MKIKKWASIFFIQSILINCSERVEDDAHYLKPMPVLNCIIQPNKPVNVNLSFTTELKDTFFQLISNAEVILTINGNAKDTLTYKEDGNYLSSFLPVEGDTINCVTFIPGFDTLTSRTIVPIAQQLISVKNISNAGIDEEGFTYPAVVVTFTSNPGHMIFYEQVIRLQVYEDESVPELINTIDPVLLSEGLTIPLFSNYLINELSYTMQINYTTGSSSGSTTRLYPLILEMRTVSEDYYHFTRLLDLYEKGRYPDGLGSSNISIQLFSNIQNGHGIFAAYSSAISDTIYPTHD